MPWYEAFDHEIQRQLPQLAVRREEPMARHTTFRIGGPARRMAFPKSEEELTALLALSKEWDPLVIGNGSNLLAPDGELDRLVISTAQMEELKVEGTALRAAAGVPLARLAAAALRAELEGLAFAHGIPGTLGGAVFMNAGAYGGEMRQVVREVRAWYPEKGVITLDADALDFGYRHSVFSGGEGVVVSALLQLRQGNGQAIRAEMEDLAARRRSRQPLEFPSAGSTFKRPEGYYAGTLIEQCGLKGCRIGGAQVSEKHAGFLINAGGASCSDVLRLIEHVQKTVFDATGVRLEPEVRVL